LRLVQGNSACFDRGDVRVRARTVIVMRVHFSLSQACQHQLLQREKVTCFSLETPSSFQTARLVCDKKLWGCFLSFFKERQEVVFDDSTSLPDPRGRAGLKGDALPVLTSPERLRNNEASQHRT